MDPSGLISACLRDISLRDSSRVDYSMQIHEVCSFWQDAGVPMLCMESLLLHSAAKKFSVSSDRRSKDKIRDDVHSSF